MLGMLGNNLEERKFINGKLCSDISSVSNTEGIMCHKCYCIGNTEEGGELQLYVDNYKKGKNSRNPIGNSMFLLKALLPDSVVRCYSKIRELVKPEHGYTRMHVYFW